MNHILIYLRAFTNTLYMKFDLVQWKSRLMQKNNPLLLFIAWVRKIEEIPHSIPDNMLTELILVGLDGHMPKNHKNQREKEFMVAKNTSGTVAVSGTNVSNL